jgi:hypothetical protein
MWLWWLVSTVALILSIVAIVFAMTNNSRGPRGRRGAGSTTTGPTGSLVTGPTGDGGSSSSLQLYVFSEAGTTTPFQVPLTSSGEGFVVLYGGGGGAAGAVISDSVSEQIGGGGGGGAWLKAGITALPGSFLSITVGMGGTGGQGVTGAGDLPAGSGAGSDATQSSISGLVTPFVILLAGGGFGAPGLDVHVGGTSLSEVYSRGGTGGIPIPAIGPNGSSYTANFGQAGMSGNLWFDGVGGIGGGCPNGGAGGVPGNYANEATQDDALGGVGTTPGGGGGGGSVYDGATDTLPRDGGNGANGLVLLYI